MQVNEQVQYLVNFKKSLSGMMQSMHILYYQML